MGMGGQRHSPAAFPLGKRPGIPCTGGWVGLRAGLDGCGKSRPPPGFDPRTVQPVASRYTDYAIPASVWLTTTYITSNNKTHTRVGAKFQASSLSSEEDVSLMKHALFRDITQRSGNFVSRFRGRLSVPFSRVKKSKLFFLNILMGPISYPKGR